LRELVVTKNLIFRRPAT